MGECCAEHSFVDEGQSRTWKVAQGTETEMDKKRIVVFSEEYWLEKNGVFMCKAAIRPEMQVPAHLLPLPSYTQARFQRGVLVAE